MEKSRSQINQKENNLLYLIVFYGLILLAGFVFMRWAYQIPFNNAPDEKMRYMIPQFIYDHGRLPNAKNSEAIFHIGYWSYGYYPQHLGAIISAIFMKCISLIKNTEFSLLFAARMTSVLFGMITVLFVGKSVYRVSRKKYLTILGMGLTAFLPQFTFLSSYVNNDIIAVAGAAIISYALISGAQECWNLKNTTCLSVGFIFCGLGYLNSYGFILAGGLFFVLSNFIDYKHSLTTIKKSCYLFIYLFILTAIFVFPFLIRNYVIYQDVFGTTIFRKEYLRWLAEGNPAYQRPFKGSILDLITDKNTITQVYQSFVGRFGYMNILMTKPYYLFYLWIAILGAVGLIIKKAKTVIGRQTKYQFVEDRSKKWVLYGCILLAVIITFALSGYYSIKIDWQPQGRYLMSILPIIVMMVVNGWNFFLDHFIIKRRKSSMVVIMLVVYLIINYFVFKNWITTPKFPDVY